MATYPGGKNGSGTYQQIINKIPPFDFYFEGFAGSAAIYRFLNPSVTSILCDMSNLQLASLKNMVRPTCIVAKFDTVRKIDFIVNFLNFLSSSGMQVFAYFDPPYLFDVRTSKKKIYEFELSTSDHIAFLTGIRSARFNCMISHYRCSQYNSMLEHWNSYDFNSTTRKGSRMDSIYFNYPNPSKLHDYSFIGSNFREREQFQRIKTNFIAKLSAMPVILRNSILNELRSTLS